MNDFCAAKGGGHDSTHDHSCLLSVQHGLREQTASQDCWLFRETDQKHQEPLNTEDSVVALLLKAPVSQTSVGSITSYPNSLLEFQLIGALFISRPKAPFRMTC